MCVTHGEKKNGNDNRCVFRVVDAPLEVRICFRNTQQIWCRTNLVSDKMLFRKASRYSTRQIWQVRKYFKKSQLNVPKSLNVRLILFL